MAQQDRYRRKFLAPRNSLRFNGLNSSESGHSAVTKLIGARSENVTKALSGPHGIVTHASERLA